MDKEMRGTEEMYTKGRAEAMTPDKMRLTSRQAERVAKLAGVEAGELRNNTISSVAEKLKWKVDPSMFFFRRVCGQVVKTDPSTGIDHPVPFATVHVMDTDCSFLGFFPIESPWAWLFPVFCHTEEIASVKTDACGKFCVWIPHFDIDWILRFRHEHYCYPTLFVKPSILDILKHLKVIEEPPVIPHGPGPVEERVVIKDNVNVFQHVQAIVGPDAGAKLRAAETMSSLGGDARQLRDVLAKPAFLNPVPPPLPTRIKEIHRKEGHEGVLRNLGLETELSGVAPKSAMMGSKEMQRVARLDLNHYVGPLIRCYDYYVAEWVPILDVPDITFEVTQDVDGDGDEETIYSEGYFDVRWNATSIPDVTLHASAIAVATPLAASDPACSPPEVPCEEPAIVLAGLMPVHNLPAPADPYIDATTGYSQRPNRPHPHGLVSEAPPAHTLATAPFTGTLQLYGCNHVEGASFYRLLYTFRAAGSMTTSSAVPFTALSWQLWRWVGSPGHLEILAVGADANGWYQILSDADGWLPAHLLLNWPTGAAGLYTLTMQFADGGKNYISGSDTTPIAMYVDNTSPTALITEIRWRVSGGAWSAPLSRTCAVVMRPAGQNLEFKVSYQASALHLRDLSLAGGGCGTGDPARLSFTGWSDPPTPEFDMSGVSNNPYEHWHTGPLDNNVTRTAIFSLAGSAQQGAYDFSLWVNGRAFNPAGGDGGFEADWNYNPVYRWAQDNLKFAIIDA